MTIMRCATYLLAVCLAGCGGPRSEPDYARLVSQLDAALPLIRTEHGRYTATSIVDRSGDRIRIRTTIVGDRRDEIGDAVQAVHAAVRRIVKQGGYGGDADGGFAQTSLTWNGKTVACTLITVEF